MKPLEALVTAAGLYWALTAIFTYFQSRLERRVSKGYVRAAAGPKAKERRKTIVTGAGGGTGKGAPAGYVLDAPDAPETLGSPHAGGLTKPVVGAPPMPDESGSPEETR